MKYSDIKKLKAFCEGLHSEPSWREVLENLGNDDFDVDNVRFIKDDAILNILEDELSSDEYILGCFNAWFLADITGIDQDVFEAMQAAEAYTAIGKLIISGGHLSSLAYEYQRQDGYGHHFNHYDGNSDEITLDGELYHVFDNH